MPHQSLVVPALVMRQSCLLFRYSEDVLDVPARERYPQYAPKTSFELISHEVLHFAGGLIDGRDQAMPAASCPYPLLLRTPRLMPQRLTRQSETPPSAS